MNIKWFIVTTLIQWLACLDLVILIHDGHYIHDHSLQWVLDNLGLLFSPFLYDVSKVAVGYHVHWGYGSDPETLQEEVEWHDMTIIAHNPKTILNITVGAFVVVSFQSHIFLLFTWSFSSSFPSPSYSGCWSIPWALCAFSFLLSDWKLPCICS